MFMELSMCITTVINIITIMIAISGHIRDFLLSNSLRARLPLTSYYVLSITDMRPSTCVLVFKYTVKYIIYLRVQYLCFTYVCLISTGHSYVLVLLLKYTNLSTF